jgi:hypothetical protein
MDINELKKMCSELQQLELIKKRQNEELKTTNNKLDELEKQILFVLEEEKLSRFDFGTGLVSRTVRTSAVQEDKTAFKEWAKEFGLWDDMASINSQTLNAYINAEKEKAEQANLNYVAPSGLKLTEYVTLSLRKN